MSRRAIRERNGGASTKVAILSSSSSGNSIFIGTDHTRILIDAGLSRKEIFARLEKIGERPESLDAVLISHEHSDHVCGLLPLLRRLDIPVFLSSLTAPAIEWGDFLPRIETFPAGSAFRIGDLRIGTFTIPHDAVDPVGFTVAADGSQCGVLTDLGYMPESAPVHLRDCGLLLLESNHDLEMLKAGPYPWSVKQRVMSRKGHLSNDVVSDFILDGMSRSLHTLVLGHLSEHNNHPAIAHLSASQALGRRGVNANLQVAEPAAAPCIFTM